jgi:hypothetical protein
LEFALTRDLEGVLTKVEVTTITEGQCLKFLAVVGGVLGDVNEFEDLDDFFGKAFFGLCDIEVLGFFLI